MWPFNYKCDHPFWALQTQKEQTVTVADEDFENVDYHFQCAKCNELLTKSHARTIGGVSAFIERGRQRMNTNGSKNAMNKEQTIDKLYADSNHGTRREDVEAEYNAGVKAEREECANIAESWNQYFVSVTSIGPRIAKAIREMK